MVNLEYTQECWMRYALSLAQKAKLEGEVPVSAVLVYNNQVIGKGWNSQIGCHDPTAHAEIIALRRGGATLQNYRLLHSTLYVTLEPCIMCFGAIVHSRISNLVYGAQNKNFSVTELPKKTITCLGIDRKVKITSGILEKECADLLTNFFQERRKKNSRETSNEKTKK